MSDKELLIRYEIRETWDEAVKHTHDDFIPLAVKLVHVNDLPEIDAEVGLGDEHYPFVLACMTTRFTDPEYDGKLGWYLITGKTRENICQFLQDNGLVETWVYLSQDYYSEEGVN